MNKNTHKKHIVLAYSGGLDTSVILHWLISKKFDVTCYVANVGQHEDFEAIKSKALMLGAKSVVVDDLRENFIKNFIFESLKANALYQNVYFMGTALARPVIAQGMVCLAKKIGATCLAHGATGKGNDQVRFELVWATLMPEAHVIALWRDQEFLTMFKGRPDLLAYAIKHKIPVSVTQEKMYSIDENIMHTSYEGGPLENLEYTPEQSMYTLTMPIEKTPDIFDDLVITFESGVPVSVMHAQSKATSPIEILELLNKYAQIHGIGRIDLLEDRCVGIKSRGVYETPGATLLWRAHRELESLTLDKDVILAKDSLMPKYAKLIYDGLWFSPERFFYQAAINQSQNYVTGTIVLRLFKATITVVSRTSTYSLYSQSTSSMDDLGDYNPQDAQGFIALQALRFKKLAQQR